MVAVRVLALLGLSAWTCGARAAPAPVPGCAAFMQDFAKAAQGHRAGFERPLTIARGFLGVEDGIEVRVLSTGEDVDGTLKCKGDAFDRFELSGKSPVSDRLAAALKVYEQAALAAAFHWDRAKAEVVVTAMSADAAEYLKASVQRGDTYQSGKVEYHQGDALDLGLIWTDSDRTFVITTQSDD